MDKEKFSEMLAEKMDYKLVLPAEIPKVVDISPLIPVEIDLQRYLGYWYERVRLPNLFEKGLSHTSADYRPSPDGTLRVTNQGWVDRENRWKTSVGLARTTQHSGVLLVTFGYIYSLYVVIYNDNYNVVIVASPSRDYLWILTRQPDTQIDMDTCMQVLRMNGYSDDQLQRLEYVVQ
jgi:lipocalin